MCAARVAPSCSPTVFNKSKKSSRNIFLKSINITLTLPLFLLNGRWLTVTSLLCGVQLCYTREHDHKHRVSSPSFYAVVRSCSRLGARLPVVFISATYWGWVYRIAANFEQNSIFDFFSKYFVCLSEKDTGVVSVLLDVRTPLSLKINHSSGIVCLHSSNNTNYL